MSSARVQTPGDRGPQRPDCRACRAARLVVTQLVNGHHPCSLTALLAREAVTRMAMPLEYYSVFTYRLLICIGIVYWKQIDFWFLLLINAVYILVNNKNCTNQLKNLGTFHSFLGTFHGFLGTFHSFLGTFHGFLGTFHGFLDFFLFFWALFVVYWALFIVFWALFMVYWALFIVFWALFIVFLSTFCDISYWNKNLKLLWY